MAESGSNNKAVVAAVAAVLLVAAVVAVAITTRNSGEASPDVASSTKAVDAICSPTQYKQRCESSLSGANTTDPKKLIEQAIDTAVKSVGEVLKKSKVLQDAAKDPLTKGAFEVCQEVLNKAVFDLKRTVGKVETFEASKAREYVADLRTWLSAVVTNQVTCVDAFDNTTGDTGEKMKKLIKTSSELSSNGLAMVTDLAEFVGALSLWDDLEGGGGGGGGGAGSTAAGTAFVNRRLLQVAGMSLKPTITVAKDGSSKFSKINDAIASLPKNNNAWVAIMIKGGLYDEVVDIPMGMNKIVLMGDGPTNTKITGKKSFKGGVQTYYTATLGVSGEDFMAKDLYVENTAGPQGEQALAVRLSGDRGILYNVVMDGNQDTLCVDTGRQFIRSSTVVGTIDYVFGNSLALLQECKLVMRKPAFGQEVVVAAQGRTDPKSNGALIFQNCQFTAEPAFLTVQPPVAAFLGRPWKPLAVTVIMQSSIDGFFKPAGWAPWIGTQGLDTCFFSEYQNRGPGSDVKGRVTWKGIHTISDQQALTYTGGVVFGGDAWIKESGVAYAPGMMQIQG